MPGCNDWATFGTAAPSLLLLAWFAVWPQLTLCVPRARCSVVGMRAVMTQRFRGQRCTWSQSAVRRPKPVAAAHVGASVSLPLQSDTDLL